MINAAKFGLFNLGRSYENVVNDILQKSLKVACRYHSSSSSSSKGGPTYHTATSAELSADTSRRDGLPDIVKIPLSEEVPWIPQPVYTTASDYTQTTRITKLDNGITVASEPKFGSFCTVGVVMDSGSRYEVAHPSGISHFLEKLAFGDTVNMKRDQIMHSFESLGGICDCQTLRDAVVYAASVESKGLEKVIDVLSEVVWRPLITDEEFEMAKLSVSFDLENLNLKPEKDAILLEMIHKAAYRDNTLGLPKICPPEALSVLEKPHIMSYLKHHHTPQRMVVAGVGVDHDLLVKYVEKSFVAGSAIWDHKPELLHPNTSKSGVDKSVAQYTGGVVTEEIDLSNVSIGPDPLPELAHLVLGLESVGHQHPDFVTTCVLNALMGGGGSFSAGGPGKGMYTRLYTYVLNSHHWMHNAVSFNHAYMDTGLFCILASAHPSNLRNLTHIISKEMVNMSCDIKEQELKRAKKQLQSMLMMNLEARPVIFEDLARQVLSNGRRRPSSYFAEKINQVTLDDIHRVATKMLSSNVSVAAYGSLKSLPHQENIQRALRKSRGFF